ncbi:MAG TPA: GGDEF domain-containing protein [Longimicrobium sp.]|nr:GGDEF domain-containing protein [Longimicrobium sp.]
MRRTRMRALQGALFGVFAAPGWAALECLTHPGHAPGSELVEHGWLYGYLLGGAALGFGVFGAVLGHHEEALLEANRRLDELAVSDPLTGLKNVRYFRARLEEACAAALRAGEPLAVIVMDLDRFKDVNDRHGHPTGDRVLRAVADAIAASVRAGDTAARVEGSVARMGGEEFALVLPETTAAGAAVVAHRLLAAVRATAVATGDGDVRVTASAGIAALEPGDSADDVYARADAAMYASKAAGRDRGTTWARPPAPEAGAGTAPPSTSAPRAPGPPPALPAWSAP